MVLCCPASVSARPSWPTVGISRQPVSHALHLLKRQGLVEDFGRKGLRVVPLDPLRVMQLYQVREASMVSRPVSPQNEPPPGPPTRRTDGLKDQVEAASGSMPRRRFRFWFARTPTSTTGCTGCRATRRSRK